MEAIKHEFYNQSAMGKSSFEQKSVAVSGGCGFSFPPHGALAMMFQWTIRGGR